MALKAGCHVLEGMARSTALPFIRSRGLPAAKLVCHLEKTGAPAGGRRSDQKPARQIPADLDELIKAK